MKLIDTPSFSCKGFNPENYNPNFTGAGGFQNLVGSRYLAAVTRTLQELGAVQVGYLAPSSGYSALLVETGGNSHELRLVWGLEYSTGTRFVGVLIDRVAWLYSHKLDPAVIDVRERWTDV
jgi:hypothetical protein